MVNNWRRAAAGELKMSGSDVPKGEGCAMTVVRSFRISSEPGTQ